MMGGGLGIRQVRIRPVLSDMPHKLGQRKVQPKGVGEDWVEDKTHGVTPTFAPDIEVPPRVSGDHVAAFQKGHTQHILRFLVFLGWRRTGRCQKAAEAESLPELTPHPGLWSRRSLPCFWV